MRSTEVLITLIVSIIGSSGIWGFILYLMKYKHSKIDSKIQQDDAERRIIRGIAHLQIIKACRNYIDIGEITTSQYSDLITLVTAYKELGGNGSVDRIMVDIEKLRIVPDSYIPKSHNTR